MAHKTTRRGGRSWWGKMETKLASKVTRRRDDKREVEDQRTALQRFIDEGR